MPFGLDSMTVSEFYELGNEHKCPKCRSAESVEYLRFNGVSVLQCNLCGGVPAFCEVNQKLHIIFHRNSIDNIIYCPYCNEVGDSRTHAVWSR